jgi:hypothetical protein
MAQNSVFQPDITRIAQHLANHPNTEFRQQLLNDLQHGARIGYSGPRTTYIAHNHNSANEQADLLTADIAQNVAEGVTKGPFNTPTDLFSFARISPLGALTKTKPDGKVKVRRVHDLSHPRGRSVNTHIPEDYVPVNYPRLREIMSAIARMGQGTTLNIADIKSAFKHVPVHPDDVPLLGFEWKGKYYFEVTLPFGLRSAPGLYDRLAEALTWILHNEGIDALFRFVDDFMLPDPPGTPPDVTINKFIAVCEALGIHLARDKLITNATTAIYLGIEFDTIRMEARLPQDKLESLRAFITQWLTKTKTTLNELQVLGGKLEWCSAVVPPGSTYNQHVFSTAARLHAKHHHIRIPAPVRADLVSWLQFLNDWNGIALLDRPHLPITVATDASSSLACGGYWAGRGEWFQLRWEPHHARCTDRSAEFSICWKELYAVVICAAIFGPVWTGNTVPILCDNMGVVDLLRNKRRSAIPEILDLIRLLITIEATHDMQISVVHIAGVANTVADAISRLRMERARALTQLDAAPQPLPAAILAYEQKLKQQLKQYLKRR